MVDYYEHRHGSWDAPYRGDPAADENAMRRSITRGSHQSHASGASPGTQSWVQSQIHRPQDATPLASPAPTPRRTTPRPLPDPQLYQAQRTSQYAPHDSSEDEDEYMHVDPNGAGTPFGYQEEDLGLETTDMRFSPAPVHHLSPPSRGGRSFVGGFFNGLKRLPKIVLGVSGDRLRSKRKGTFGTDNHTEVTLNTIATGMTTGNTLPRYLSNPSIRPSNPNFAHRLSMAVANGSLPPDSTPAVFHVRNNPHGPQFPTLTVTPASDGIVEEEQADFYEGPLDDQPQYSQSMGPDRNINDRTTFMVYNTDSQAPTVAQAPTEPILPRQPTPGPRVSYQAQLPTRANVQAQHEPMPVLVPIPVHTAIPPHSPREIISLNNPTSNYTISAVPSAYDPSFASDLTPIEKFFKGFYNLPWIASERVTVDYRPADSQRAQSKVKGLKKPMASWYRTVMARRASRNLDALSSRTPTISTGTSLGNTLSPLGSPISRGSGRSSHNSRHNHSFNKKRHRRNRNRTTSPSRTGTQLPQRSTSPIIPTTYPYAYPGYPYAYPYGAYPTTMPVPHTSPRGPRSHRHNKPPKYPHGYAPYQPMNMPPQMPGTVPPIYFVSPSPPQSQFGGEGNHQLPVGYPMAPPGAAGPMQVSPVIMHFVPGTFNQNQAMISPPLTPHRQGA